MMHQTEDKTRGPVHLGRKAQRVREIRGWKQSDLADRLGMSQQNISKLEQSEDIPDDVLEKLAVALGVQPEFIRSFDEEKIVWHIENNPTYNDDACDYHTQNIHSTVYNNNSPEVLELLDKAVKALADLSKALQSKPGTSKKAKGRK